ncbi:MAG: hypothetical protein QW469_01615 [Candidatus Aenigmatarchaeota archaeon]
MEDIEKILKQLNENCELLNMFFRKLNSSDYNSIAFLEYIKNLIEKNDSLVIIGYKLDESSNIYTTEFPLNLRNELEVYFEGLVGLKLKDWNTVTLIPKNKKFNYLNEKEKYIISGFKNIFNTLKDTLIENKTETILYDKTNKKAYQTKFNPEEISKKEKEIFKVNINHY